MNFSFCIIGKNESSHIRSCLPALKKCGQEIVYVDTGSSDDTVAVAKEFTDKVFFFEWINDFSAARNFAMEQASEDMIFFVDCDEYLEEDSSVDEALSLMERYPDALGQILRRNLCDDGNGGQTIYEDRVERLFDRRLFKYTGSIHEQPVRRDGSMPSAYHLPMYFSHDGYLGTPEQKKKKGERDLSLLLKDLEENRKRDLPDDPYIFYQLGQACTLMADKDKAVEYYSLGLKLPLDPTLTYVQMMITNYGNALTDSGRPSEALLLDRYADYIDDYADYFTMLGFAALQAGKYLTSAYYYKKALTAPRHNLTAAADALPHHNLGCIYEGFGDYPTAIAHFTAADKAGHKYSADRASALKTKLKSEGCGEKTFFHNYIIICDADSDQDKVRSSMNLLKDQTVGFDHVMVTFVCLSHKEWERSPLFDQIRTWETESPDNILVLEADDYDRNTSGTEILGSVLQYSTAPLLSFLKPGDRIHVDHARTIKEFFDLLHNYSPSVIRCGIFHDQDNLYLEPAREKDLQAWKIPHSELISIINNKGTGLTFSGKALSDGGNTECVLADTGMALIIPG
ncbi:MAG: glycosyltransferase [Lachnospiraceae bacterium]|nr:glycosyltransferase [Lachnospiraceae bacterium]